MIVASKTRNLLKYGRHELTVKRTFTNESDVR